MSNTTFTRFIDPRDHGLMLSKKMTGELGEVCVTGSFSVISGRRIFLSLEKGTVAVTENGEALFANAYAYQPTRKHTSRIAWRAAP
jgi:hypothetical protein